MHVMFSTRREDVPSERTPAQWFRLAAPAHKDPLTGGVKKDAVWDQKKTLQGLRHETAILINAALEREGHPWQSQPHRCARRAMTGAPSGS